MAFTKRQSMTAILILGLLSAIGPLSIDMYLPGFEGIATSLETSVAHVQLSLTSFFIGIAAGQLVYGPLLDRFGRKLPLLVGLIIYILASFGCVLIDSADALVAYRFVQALGSCAGMVAARAMVRDFFPPQEAARVFSWLMLVIGVSPILAPTIGSYIMQIGDWHGIFVVLGSVGIAIFVSVVLFLPPAKQPDKSISLKPKAVLTSFYRVLSVRQFLSYAFSGALASAGLYAYLAGSPFVMTNLYGLTEKQYGLVFALIAAALVISTQINRVLLRRIPSERLAKGALILQSLFGILLATLTAAGWMNLPIMVGLIFLFLGCQGFVFPNTSALSLIPFRKLAGSASAMLGCIQMGIGAISSALVSYFHNLTAVPMTTIMAGCALSSLLVITIAAPSRRSDEL